MRIDESRDSLVQKIEQLEEKVTESVEMATATVAEATEAVMETVQNATTSVSETVDSVTGAVQGTVDNVRESVEGAVASVKDAFDLNLFVTRHPWLAVAGSVGLGILVERLVENVSRTPMAPDRPVRSFIPDEQFSSIPVSNGQPMSSYLSSNGETIPPTAQPAGLVSTLVETFGPEISKLKSLAIAAGLSALKEVCIKNAPSGLQQPVSTMIDDFTERLGAEPLHGSLFAQQSPGSARREGKR